MTTIIPGSDYIYSNDNLSVVVDRKQDVFVDTWVIDLHTKKVYQSKGQFKQSPDNELVFAVAYSIGSEVLPGIKVIRVKSDEETENNKWSATDYLNSHNLERGKSFNLWKVIVRGAFALGFRACQSKYKFTEEDMRNCFEQSRLTHPMVGFKHDTFDEYLKALHPSIESLTITESPSGIIGEVKYREK